MIPIHRSFACSVWILTLLVLSGCGSGHGLEGETGTVTGRLTYNGKPLPAGSSITMLHKGKGFPASGVTDVDGNFALKMRGEPEILVGEYNIGVTPPSANESPDDSSMGSSPDRPTQAATTPELIPAKLQSPETSGQSATVAAGPNHLQIDLKE